MTLFKNVVYRNLRKHTSMPKKHKLLTMLLISNYINYFNLIIYLNIYLNIIYINIIN